MTKPTALDLANVVAGLLGIFQAKDYYGMSLEESQYITAAYEMLAEFDGANDPEED